MMKQPLTYSHPQPWQRSVQRFVGLLTMALGVVGALVLTATAFLLPAPLFAFMALLVLLLMAPVLWLLVGTPPVSLSEDGLTLHEFTGHSRTLAWDDVASIHDYPLLPTEQNEVLRRLFQGRKNYRPAEGIMLVVPSLPWPYRIGGFFAGQGTRPIFALTSRTHQHYAELTRIIIQTIPDTIAKEPPA